MRSSGRKHIILPDVWVTHDVRSRTSGRIVKTYYINLKTRKKFYSKAALYRHFRGMQVQSLDCSTTERAEENKGRVCSVCDEIGHCYNTCPYPVIQNQNMNPFAGANIRRCSRCHWLGHNVRTCPEAI